MGLYKRGAIWWYEWTTPNRERKRESTHCRNRDAAEHYARELMRREELSWSRTPCPGDLIEQFLASARAGSASPRYAKQRKAFFDGLWESQKWPAPSEVTPGMVSIWLDSEAKRVSVKTLHNRFRYLSAFFRWAFATGSVTRNPCYGLVLPRARLPLSRRAMSLAEIRSVARATEPPYCTVYLWLALTGLRRGETRTVKWGWIDGNRLLMPPYATKSKREEVLPLPAELVESLRTHREWMADHGRPVTPASLVFQSLRIGRRCIGAVPKNQRFRKDLAAAGIAPKDEHGRELSIHCLRHSLATNLAQSGAEAVDIQRLLRHADVRTSMRYVDRQRVRGEEALKKMLGQS